MMAAKERDWYVVDMDDGIVRREKTKKACLEWAIREFAVSERILPGNKRMGDGFYEYFVGEDREDCTQIWIAQGVAAARGGFDLDQRPLYPHADQPHERVDREEEKEDGQS